MSARGVGSPLSQSHGMLLVVVRSNVTWALFDWKDWTKAVVHGDEQRALCYGREATIGTASPPVGALSPDVWRVGRVGRLSQGGVNKAGCTNPFWKKCAQRCSRGPVPTPPTRHAGSQLIPPKGWTWCLPCLVLPSSAGMF